MPTYAAFARFAEDVIIFTHAFPYEFDEPGDEGSVRTTNFITPEKARAVMQRLIDVVGQPVGSVVVETVNFVEPETTYSFVCTMNFNELESIDTLSDMLKDELGLPYEIVEVRSFYAVRVGEFDSIRTPERVSNAFMELVATLRGVRMLSSGSQPIRLFREQFGGGGHARS